jgi:hypothetical protein
MSHPARSRLPAVLVAALAVGAPLLGPARAAQAAALQPDEPPPYRAAEPPLTNAEIVRLWRAGLGSELIVAKVRQAPSEHLDVSAEALIALHRSKVSDAVITAILQRVAARVPPPSPPSPPPADAASEAENGAAASDSQSATGTQQQGASGAAAERPPAGTAPPWTAAGIPAVAARVNGVAIGKDALLKAERAARTAATTNEAPTAASCRRAVDALIDRELLLQEAAAAGITATGDEVRVEITALKNHFSTPGDFAAKMQAQGISDAGLHRMALDSIVVRKLLDRAVYGEAVVTEQEARAFFEQHSDQMKQRTFAAVQEQIGKFLLQQKRQERLQSHLKTLRAAARIEIYL